MTEKRCARCGRTGTDLVVRPVDDDRGPVEVVWCADAASCEAARAAIQSRWPRRVPGP